MATKARDERIEYIVFGYTRREYGTKSSKHVPAAIKYICIKYYHINDHFTVRNKEDDHNLIQLNDKQDIASCFYQHPECGWPTREIIYGKNGIIDPNDTSITKYKWTFKLLSLPNQYDSVYIGIDSSEVKTNFNYNALIYNPEPDKYPCYGFQIRSGGQAIQSLDGDFEYFRKVCDNDIIEMAVDTQDKTLYCYLDNENCGAFGDNINMSPDLKYHLAVCIERGDEDKTSIQFVKFAIEQ